MHRHDEQRDRLARRHSYSYGRLPYASEAGTRHVLVLDLVLDAPDRGLAAAAMLVIDGPRGHLVLLAVSKRFEGLGVEEHLTGILESVCRAFGADLLDVTGLHVV